MSASNEEHSIRKVTSDLDLNSLSVVGDTVNRNEALIDEIHESRASFLRSLMPDPRRRAMVMEQLQSVKDDFEFRRRVLSMVRETQLQALKESCNQYLVTGKAAVRADMGKFLAAKAADLALEVDNTYAEFTKQMEKRWEEAESIRVPRIRQIRLEQLDKDLIRFARLKDQLSEKFIDIASEGV